MSMNKLRTIMECENQQEMLENNESQNDDQEDNNQEDNNQEDNLNLTIVDDVNKNRTLDLNVCNGNSFLPTEPRINIKLKPPKQTKLKRGKKSQAEINAQYSLFKRDQNDKSRITIHGENNIEFSADALPGHAKLIIKRSERFERRNTNFDSLDDDNYQNEEEENDEQDIKNQSNIFLGDFISNNNIVTNSLSHNNFSEDEYILYMERVKNSVECMQECLCDFNKYESEKNYELLECLSEQCEQLETFLLTILEINNCHNRSLDDENNILSLLQKINSITEEYNKLMSNI